MAEHIHDFLGAQYPLKAIPGFYGPRPGIREHAHRLLPPTPAPHSVSPDAQPTEEGKHSFL